jgi:hypothetical protein
VMIILAEIIIGEIVLTIIEQWIMENLSPPR